MVSAEFDSFLVPKTRTVKSLFFLLVTSSLLCHAQHGKGTSAESNSTEVITHKLDNYLASLSKAYRFNGTALIAKGDHILLHKGYGWQNVDAKLPNTEKSVFQIASLTKPFTAIIILQLQESGHLSLKDKLSKFLPDFPNGDRITVEQLLTHTSGLANIDVEETDTITWSPVSKREILASFKDIPLAFTPGTQFSYRNSGYFLLGLIIEKVTGVPYQKVVRERLIEPLQMSHSGFDFIHLKDPAKVTGYTILTADRQQTAHLIDSTVTFASGDIFSTTGDLYKWARSVAARQFLSAKTWKKALTPFKEQYGYGWFIDKINGENCFGHSGGTYGFASNLTYFPKEEVTIILLNNILNESQQAILPVEALSAIVLGKPYLKYEERKEVKIDPKEADRFLGTYALTSDPKRTMIIKKKGDQLVADLSGKTLELVFTSGMDFQFKNVPLTVTGKFVAQDQEVTKLIISQNGVFEWKKIK